MIHSKIDNEDVNPDDIDLWEDILTPQARKDVDDLIISQLLKIAKEME